MAPFTIGGVRVRAYVGAMVNVGDDSRRAQRDSYFHQSPPITSPF